MSTNTLLIELGTEELPPKSLKTLAETFFQQIKSQLDSAELSYTDIKWFATPRRLAVKATQVTEKQTDKLIEKRGPAVNVAFDEQGNPSKAAQGWARSNGITVEQAERLTTPKGEWLLHKATELGKSIHDLVPNMVNVAVNKLPIPKPMRWGSSRTQFIRPVHTLVMMYGDQIITGETLGVSSNKFVTGHRFHHEGLVELHHADNYEEQLENAYVMVDFERRQNTIRQQLDVAAKEINGKVLMDENLLEEVNALVEWPITLTGSFDESFLNVPPEPLIYSMKDHQKYFPVEDQNGKLLNKFIFVSNIESKDPQQVVFGNEKVIRPRLADAEFFFKTDKKQSLESRLVSLETVLFQKQLGTLKDKSSRIADLSAFIANTVGDNASHAHRAGILSKTDLMSDMVLEFPQVQGTMGKYYAEHDGELPEVAQALEDQYRPRFSGDSLPQGNIGCAVAIADKIDTLVGIFGINQQPKGDKDPFALRRAAIGTIRIIVEKKLTVDLKTLIQQSIEFYGEKLSNENTLNEVLEFISSRYRAFYQEQKISVDVIQAVLANATTLPLDFDKRIHAVNHFKSLDQAQTLAAANKRVGNILAKFTGDLFNEVDNSLLQEDAEKQLAEYFSTLTKQVEQLVDKSDYQEALSMLAALKEPIDLFFDNVMVMAEDESVKTNRLTLLNSIRQQFLAIADISLLQ